MTRTIAPKKTVGVLRKEEEKRAMPEELHAVKRDAQYRAADSRLRE